MPKSKRNVKVSLTKTKKRPREKKDALIEEIRTCCEKYPRLYLLSLQNERNVFLQAVRQHFRPGRLICAKNKVMQLALGTSPESECQDGVHQVAEMITGPRALLFTDRAPAEVHSYFADYRPIDFARAGAQATETVVLPRGKDALANLPHSIEAHLRQLGMPTQLLEGKIHLLGDFTVCTQGKELTSDAAQILKLLDLKQAQFTMNVECHWHKGGEFKDCNELED
mmetsp:Transcript_123600/g.242498  ORF Transcript_123600/g.242498 Transcript_123600/m.242498 type:complete len:225 (-) Transcript_123600:215-889(-)